MNMGGMLAWDPGKVTDKRRTFFVASTIVMVTLSPEAERG
jgi:hypothetical protein